MGYPAANKRAGILIGIATHIYIDCILNSLEIWEIFRNHNTKLCRASWYMPYRRFHTFSLPVLMILRPL